MFSSNCLGAWLVLREMPEIEDSCMGNFYRGGNYWLEELSDLSVLSSVAAGFSMSYTWVFRLLYVRSIHLRRQQVQAR